MKMDKKGFTLVELMIVVAIIGILAAVAIPGFMKYIKDSKTTEAKTNIKAVAEGALSFYQTEHPVNTKGEGFFTKQYPSADYCRTISDSDSCSATLTPRTPALQPAGQKTKGEFGAEPWISLNFTTTAPVYYSYYYLGTAGDDGKGSSFISAAGAKLDKATAVDSCFKIEGKVESSGDPSISAIIDLSEAPVTECGATSGK